MKKIILSVYSAIIICLSVNAQNLVYDANAEVRKVENFSGVEVGGGINLYLSQGNTQAVAVSAEDAKYVSKIKTEVKDGVLKIYLEKGAWNGWNWGNKKIKAYVTVTELKSLDLSGGSVGKIADAINVSDLKLDLSGGSIVEGKITGNNLNMNLSGGSIGTLTGNFTNANVDASGGSILKAYDTNLASCKVEASGGSIINVTISKEMSAEASGGSIINYKGDGVIKNIDASGGSIIKKKDS
ncbi:MAG: head GIN domain-containing protein [Chitinophagaceae bacterium]